MGTGGKHMLSHAEMESKPDRGWQAEKGPRPGSQVPASWLAV